MSVRPGWHWTLLKCDYLTPLHFKELRPPLLMFLTYSSDDTAAGDDGLWSDGATTNQHYNRCNQRVCILWFCPVFWCAVFWPPGAIEWAQYISWLDAVVAPGMGWGLSPKKFRLAPFCETRWSRIRRWIVQNFQIFIVSAVEICKQYLQTASAFGGLCPPTPTVGALPLDPTGELTYPRPPDCSPKWKLLMLPLAGRHKSCINHTLVSLDWVVSVSV